MSDGCAFISAPASRTILNPLVERDGQKIAIAGLFTSGNLRNKNVEIAMSEPVFPHDTITLAFFSLHFL